MRFSAVISVAIASLMSGAVYADNLYDIYSLAQTKDPVILQIKANRDIAREAVNEVNAAKLPQISIQGDTHYIKTNKHDSGTAYVAGGNISLRQAIWHHENFINSSIAEKQATVMDLNYNYNLQNLILRTCTAYFNVLEAQDILEFKKANRDALKRRYDESNQKFAVGLIANTDVQEAKAAFDLATAQVIIAENNLANRFENLRQITGIDHKNLAALDISRFSTPGVKNDAKYWMNTAEENNIDLQAKMLEKEIAKDQISLAQTGHEPTLDLYGQLGSQYTDYKENNLAKEDGTINSGVIGLELNLPLYTGGAVSSKVEQAKLNYVAAGEALENAHRTVQTALYSQYNNINASIGTVAAYAQTVTSAQSALDATESGYDVGTRTIVDVLDATDKLYNAKSNLASARYNYILSWLNLRFTSGLLSEEDVKIINSGLVKQ